MLERWNLRIAAAAVVLAATSSSLVEAQQQCSTRPNIMFCGNTQRTGANLYSGVGPFTEVSGCAPTSTTQALLVTRSGSIAGNGPAWLAYLNAGGRIITEYNIAENVYNEIYGTAYPQGGGFGSCSDNAMPAVKLNPSDAFWQANAITPTTAGNEGCGYDLSGLVAGEGANVTPLGGASTGQVMFVRRNQGSGSLFLLEADWQDNEASFTNDSRLFMGAVISACGLAPQQTISSIPVDNPLALLGLGSIIALLGAGYAKRRAAKK